MSQTKKLAAIVFTDIVGYTALMGRDQELAMRVLSTLSSLQDPLIQKHSGRKLKDLGDGTLISFESASDAVNFSIDVQKAVKPVDHLELRIGVHLGDVIFKDDNIYGDGVNIASRLESIANPGEILISESIRRAIRGMNIPLKFIGEKKLKNVDFPVRCYCIMFEGASSKRLVESKSARVIFSFLFIVVAITVGALIFLNRDSFTTNRDINYGSIAVLPLDNLSSDEESYFSDGITMDIISKLNKVPDLKVKAHSVTKKYRNSELEISTIGDNLEVATILNGSIQKQEDKVRVYVELVDVESGESLWSDTYDGRINDIFNMQSEIALSVADELNYELLNSTQEQIEKTSKYDPEAYEYFLRGEEFIIEAGNNEDDIAAGINLIEKSLELDSSISKAYAYLGTSYGLMRLWYGKEQYTLDTAYYLINKSIQLDSSDAEPYFSRAILNGLNGLTTMDSVEMDILKAIELNPNDPEIWDFYSMLVMEERGDLQKATEYQLKSFELNKDKMDDDYIFGLSNIYYKAGLFEKAQEYLSQCLLLNPDNFAYASRQRALCIIRGELEKALKWSNKCKEIDPAFGLANEHIGSVYLLLSEYALAADEFAICSRDSWNMCRFYLEYAKSRQGDEVAFDSLKLATIRYVEWLDNLEEPTRWQSYYTIGASSIATGNEEDGIRLLEQSIELGSALSYLKFDFEPLLDSMRETPEYVNLLAKVNAQRKINQDIIRKALFEWEANEQMEGMGRR